jgi:hypothetical protein
LQGAAVGVGQARLDQRCEQVLPAGLFLGVPGAQGVVAEQQRDELQPTFGGHVDLFEHPERCAQCRPGILVGRAFREAFGDQFALFGQAAQRQVFLAAEVVEQGPPGDARGRGDLFQGGVVVALLGEQLDGGAGEQRAHDGAGLFPKRFLGHAPMVRHLTQCTVLHSVQSCA